MINLQNILRYVPSRHGEHGVDSVLHRLCKSNTLLHESYSNPPGASWAEITLLHPTGTLYHWDHMPRAPALAKRPDSIIQFNDNEEIHLLAIESKEKITDSYANMANLLKNFFIGSSNYDGIFNRPFWHRTFPGTTSSYIKNEQERYWIKEYTSRFVYSGFAFSFDPEYYENMSFFDSSHWTSSMQDQLDKEQLDIVIGVGWHGVEHIPFTKIVTSDSFKTTKFAKTLTKTLTI